MSAIAALGMLAPAAIVPLLFLDRAGRGGDGTPDELGTNLVLGAIMLVSDFLVLALFAALYGWLAPLASLLPPVPFAAQVAIAIVAGDLLSYLHHRLLHRRPWLWASHVVHHQSRGLELSSGLRNHPFATVTLALAWSPLLLLGIAPPAMLAAMAVIGGWAVLTHRSEAGWNPAPPPPLRWLLNTPAHHRLHHREARSEADCNYGLLLIVWDRLFGTYCPPASGAARFGVAGAASTGPIRRLLWDEWLAVLGRAPPPAAGGREARATGGRGLAFYLGAVLLVAASAALLARGGG